MSGATRGRGGSLCSASPEVDPSPAKGLSSNSTVTHPRRTPEKSNLLRLLMRRPPHALPTPRRIAAPRRLSSFHRALPPPGTAFVVATLLSCRVACNLLRQNGGGNENRLFGSTRASLFRVERPKSLSPARSSRYCLFQNRFSESKSIHGAGGGGKAWGREEKDSGGKTRSRCAQSLRPPLLARVSLLLRSSTG